jgi:hypothetical protein
MNNLNPSRPTLKLKAARAISSGWNGDRYGT